MNFVAHVEDLLRDLGAEARKKHPGVKEASERALLTLRSLQTQYVSAVRSHPSSKHHPSTKLFRSQDVLRPFLLACNYPDANAKLLAIGLNAIQLLINGDAVIPEDSVHIARVLVIQASVSASLHSGEVDGSISSAKQSSSIASSLIGTVSAGISSAVTGSSSSASSNAPRTRKDDEAICIKLLQTLTMVVASKELVLSEEVLSQCIMVCLILIGSCSVGPPNTSYTRSRIEGASSVIKNRKHFTQHADKHSVRVKRAAVGTLKQLLSLAIDRINLPASDDVTLPQHLQQTRKAVASAFVDLCALAENRMSENHRVVSGLPPKSEISGPFSSQGKIAGSGRQYTHYAQMPPRPTCFEFINLLLSQCPSLFLSKNNSAKDSIDFSILLRTKACPVLTTTLFSEFSAVPNMIQYIESEDFNQQQLKLQPKTIDSLDFSLFVRCCEVASTVINEFGLEKQLCAECHMLITCLVKFVTEATDGYHKAEIGFGFEDGFVYSTSKARKDPEHIDANGNISSSVAGRNIRQPNLISNALLWRAALALETIYKLTQSSQLIHFLHFDAQQLSDTLIPALAARVSDFAIITASNEASIRNTISSARRTALVQNDSNKGTYYRLETKVIARAREYAKFFDDWDCVDPPAVTTSHNQGSNSSPHLHGEYATLASLEFAENNTPACDEGETILLSLHCVIALISSVQRLVKAEHAATPPAIPISITIIQDCDQPSLKTLVDSIFAPCLSALQHFLKRCHGYHIVVEHALFGYEQLANASFNLGSSNKIHRKALLASLCKLCLPSWGKASYAADPAHHHQLPDKPLQDHHVQILHALLKIIHRNPNQLEQDWSIVLSTLDQLSGFSVPSPGLSNSFYQLAESIASAYGRLAEFTKCLQPISLQFFVAALIDLSNADTLGLPPSLPDDESTITSNQSITTFKDANNNGTTPTRGSNITSAPLSFFSFAGRALGVHGADSFSEVSSSSLLSDQVRVAASKTYGTALYASIPPVLPEKGNTSAQKKDATSFLPFPLVLLVKAASFNMQRFACFGKSVIQHLCDLAVSHVQDFVRSYATDTVAYLITSRFNSSFCDESSVDFPPEGKIPMKILDETDNLLMLEDSERRSSSTLLDERNADDNQSDISLSQQEVISPLCLAISRTYNPIGAEAGLGALFTILENTGHDIKGSVTWSMLIRSISACSGNATDRSNVAWATCGMLAFRCLKLIVDDFLDVLPEAEELSIGQSAQEVLLDCCASFGSSTHDVNTSLTATGMLWTIADRDPIDSTLNSVFEKLANLACDHRAEVRNCSVNTLFLCVVGVGNKLTEDQWKSCITGTIFGVLDKVSTFNETGKESNERGQSNREKRYRVNVHHTRDSAEKLWQATLVLTLRGLERLLRQFFLQLLRTTFSTLQPTSTTLDTSQDIESLHNSVSRLELEEARPLCAECADKYGDSSQLNKEQTFINVVSTVESGKSKTSWFLSAWGRIITVALKWASTPGGREILDLRLVGVDILVLCSQLSSMCGIDAASITVRVGTNMQVINGALRSVRPKSTSSLPATEQIRQLKPESHTISEETETQRAILFEIAFGALEEFTHNIKADEGLHEEENALMCGGSTTLQVLTRLSMGLSKLYECCKLDEFSQTFDNVAFNFEARFVTMVRLAASKSVGQPNSKYLNQSQRTCLELLKVMSQNSSWRAFETIAILGGNSFIFKPSEKNSDCLEDDDSQLSSPLVSEILELEAAKIVADAFLSEIISNLVKASVLSMILGMFQIDRDEIVSEGDSDEAVSGDTRCYTLLVPVVEGGLKAASILEICDEEKGSGSLQIQNALQETVWERMIASLSYLLSPLNARGSSNYAPHTEALLKIIASTIDYAPVRIYGDLAAVLANGILHARKVACLNFTRTGIFNPSEMQPTVPCSEAIMIFRSCFKGLCRCEPESPELCSIAMSVLENYCTSGSKEDLFFDDHPTNFSSKGTLERQRKNSIEGKYEELFDVNTELALIVCECIKDESPSLRSLFVSVFTQLCKLTNCESHKLRLYAGAALGTFNLSEAVSDGNQRMIQFEKRAHYAERRVKELEAELEEVKAELERARISNGS